MLRTTLSFLGFIVAVGVFFVYTQPKYNEVQARQQQNDQYNQALDKAAELQQLKTTLLSSYNAFNPADTSRLQKLLPDHVDNVRLILDIDNLAGQYGMALQNVVINTPTSGSTPTAIGAIGASKDTYDSLTLKFTTHGTYPNFIRFMQALESSLRIVDLISLSLQPEAAGGSSAGSAGTRSSTSSYRYDITIRTYWLR